MNLEGSALFGKAAELEKERKSFILCVIDHTDGSTPRKAGTAMIVTEEGETYGTVGGGSVESSCFKHALRMLKAEMKERDNVLSGDIAPLEKDALPLILSFDLRSENNGGSVCGGRTDVRFLQSEEEKKEFFERASALYSIENAYLIGGGHIGQALSPILKNIGFSVTVVDDRDFVKDQTLFSGADRIICCKYEDLSEFIKITDKDYVVVTTFGHKGDLETLRQVLPYRPRYLGCIGSRKKAAHVREKLCAFGFSEAEIDLIHSPIGLSIGAETPQEIAVSIAAEMIACRHRVVDNIGLPLADSRTEIHPSKEH